MRTLRMSTLMCLPREVLTTTGMSPMPTARCSVWSMPLNVSVLGRMLTMSSLR